MRFLTYKQTAFWVEYVRNGGRAVEAYRTAYDCSRMNNSTVYKEAHKLLRNPIVAKFINGTYTINDLAERAPIRNWMMRGYYVYLLVDPRDGLPFYVGKGFGPRHRQHLEEWGRLPLQDRLKTRKLSRITEIYDSGRRVHCVLDKEGLTEAAAFKRERVLIRQYRPILTNESDGIISAPEVWLGEIEGMIGRMRTPSQWVQAIDEEMGRIPTVPEMEGYVESFLTHMRMRREFRQMMMEDDADTGQLTTRDVRSRDC